MKKIKLREFALKTEREMLDWINVYHPLEVEDDNNSKVVTNTYDMMLSWYLLELHRNFPDFPYSVKEVLSCKIYNDDSMIKVLNYMVEKIIKAYRDPSVIDYMKMIIHNIRGKLNNFLYVVTERGVLSASAISTIEVADHPKVKELKQRIMKHEISIQDGEVEFKDIFLNDPDLDNNVFALMGRTGDVNITQSFQTVVMRGMVFDLNGQIFPNPIYDSYEQGIVNLADSIADSRSAGVSLNNNERPLQESEYLHRELHILANVISGIEYDYDCNTPMTVPMKVVSRNFLTSLFGKFYLKDGELRVIDNDEAKNIKVGDVLEVRSVGYCGLLSKGKVCHTCFGLMAASIPYNVYMKRSANVGIFATSIILHVLSQGTLSTKHFLKSSVNVPFVVGFADQGIITTNGDDIYLDETFNTKSTKLKFSKKILTELNDFMNLDNINDIDHTQISSFKDIGIIYLIENEMIGGDSEIETNVVISSNSRKSKMSFELITYITKNGWEEDSKGYVLIDLSNWDVKEPLFSLPLMHESLDQVKTDVKAFIQSGGHRKDNKEITNEEFGKLIIEFFELLEKKLGIFNIYILELTMSALLTKDPDNLDYSLPNPLDTHHISKYKECVENRGMGGIMAYQGQRELFQNIFPYLVKNRQLTVYDPVLNSVL